MNTEKIDLPEISISELKGLQAESLQVEAEIDNVETTVLKPLRQKLAELDAKIITALQANDLDSFKSEHGTFYIMRRFTYQTPKTIEDKKAFGKFLADKGNEVFWDKISFNHQTVQGICKEEMERAKETGDMDFTIAGIKEPSVQEILSKRRK